MAECTVLRIALNLNVQFGYGRETLRGIIDAAPPHQSFSEAAARRRWRDQQWRFQLFSGIDDPAGHRQQRELQAFNPDGIIYENLRLHNSKNLQYTLRTILERIPGPKVELYRFDARPKWPAISSDDAAVGCLAAEYFRGLGLRHFAFFGDQRYDYSRLRRAGFEDAVKPAERSDEGKHKPFSVPYYDRGEKRWRKGVQAWILSLPVPVGIFSANDLFATELLDEVAHTSRAVPEEIALLGVDNDDLLCDLAFPRISSIVPGFRQVGRAAVRVLAQLLAGNSAPASETLIPPLRVVSRQSTDILHVPDPQVGAAIQFIRAHAMENISVKELVQKVPGNRRRLEKKFFDLTGRTPMEEIHRVRVAKAKELLMADKSVEQVAHEMRFSSPKYFATLFHRVTHLTPSEFKLRNYRAVMDAAAPALPADCAADAGPGTG